MGLQCERMGCKLRHPKREDPSVHTAIDGIMEFDVGDRVIRPVDFHALKSPVIHGEVVASYGEPDQAGPVYAVLWDGDTVPKCGYLSWGIDSEFLGRPSWRIGR